jgi:hypothetical protein
VDIPSLAQNVLAPLSYNLCTLLHARNKTNQIGYTNVQAKAELPKLSREYVSYYSVFGRPRINETFLARQIICDVYFYVSNGNRVRKIHVEG